MDKRTTVIESIQRLLTLGVSDKEIADNLADVGINNSDAMEMIREARIALMGTKQPVAKDGTPIAPQSKSITGDESSLGMDEEVVQQIPIEKTITRDESGIKIKETKRKSLPQTQSTSQASAQDKDLMDEDEGIEEFDDGEAEALAEGEGVAEETPAQASGEAQGSREQSQNKEAPQTQAASSQDLTGDSKTPNPKKPSSSADSFSSSLVGAEFGEDFGELWEKGIVVAVNAKLAEMKHLKEEIDSMISQKVEDSIRKELYQFKVLIDSQKDLIISSNKEALEQKQKEIAFIIDAKIAELRQYNRQLGENIATIDSSKKHQEAAMQQLSDALEDAKKTKSELVVELNSELIKSKSSAQSFLDLASGQLAQMDERINKALELEKNIAEGMLAQAEQRIEQLTISRADELIGALQVELNKLQTASTKISPEAIEQKITVLDEFKKQFLSSMQDSLNQINTAIEELNEKSAAADRALQEKSLAIDAKLEELTKFEKEFLEKIGRSTQ